jgi:hypothetical protein
LLHVVAASHSIGGFAGCLNRWQEQSNQHADDCYHHEQLDQCKRTMTQALSLTA